ncbi:FkbM family methyltransferase [Candidatus Bathyarchaeota archaeon]|nr:FkbM family methyltransferase [Candidatus Bathyarchaeota archaeon]
MNKEVVLRILKQLLESMPKWIFPVSAALSCIVYPQMEKIVIIPRKNFCRVIWKRRNLFAPSKSNSLLFAYPRPFQRWLRIRRGDVVFEGGSTIGEDTVRIAEIVGSEGRVFAVEPDPVNLKFLQMNVRGFRNVKVIGNGIWKCKGELYFYVEGTLSGSILISGEVIKRSKYIKIPVDSIDNMVRGEKVDIIKLNIEGAEIEVLEGAKRTLKTVREVLIAAHHIRNGEYTAKKVANILGSEGFHVKIVHGILAHHYVVARRSVTP